MKITRIDAIQLAVPMVPQAPPSPWETRMRRQVLVRIHTDTEIVGISEGFAVGSPSAVCAVIRDQLAPLLIDNDPTRVEALADVLHHAVGNYGRRGIGLFAVSALEIGLWDILGKSAGLSVCDLLGGPVRPRMPAYASLLRYDEPRHVAAACEQWVRRGYRMIKLHQIDVASARAARQAVGPDVAIMLDTNMPWNADQAREMADALEEFDLYWLEEPIWPPEDYAALADLRTTAPMRIALGENEGTALGFRSIIEHAAADVLQPSILKCGGIGEMRRIVTLATAANVAVAPHSFYHGPGLTATMHVAATFASHMPVEIPAYALVSPLIDPPVAVESGLVLAPSGPGLGTRLVDETIETYAVR
jgi:L-alanine-DL-glutamate epimerase-like enolase superfamily enzyme